MNRKNLTRNALFTSIISLLLCVSMLVGTTFAWFTDEVVSGMNTIAAGNLDVELLANGSNVSASTTLFDEVDLWEPGVVVYENLQVANVGTLALKYQMTLNFGEENNLNGHKLSEVLKVAVVETDKIAGSTREQVLNAAKGSGKTLTNFYLTGELAAGASSEEQTIVIYWEPNENAVDNLYNANNGQLTSDGQPLHIKFGINLQATQLMHEEDSFGPDYDGPAAFLPKATVNNQGVKTVTATMGIGGATDEYELPFTLQFLPNEKLNAGEDQIEGTADDYLDSEYKLWHADYVVKADRDVPANSVALLGYYNEWCQYNNDNWVAMINDGADIAAGTEIRLVELLGATVNYEEICRYGNDPKDVLPAELEGFLCGATDLTGANAGTTITVELRMYEVPAKGECANGGGCNHPAVGCETGEYKVAGTYKYTFPAAPVADDAAMDEALADGITSLKLAAGNYTVDIPAEVAGKKITIEGAGNSTVVDFTKVNGANGASITFKNMKFQGKNENVMNGFGIQNTTGHIVFENCTFDGAVTNEYFGSVSYKNCTFTGTGYITTYAVKSASFENCTFNKADSRAVLVYSHGDNPCVVTLTGCTFKAAAQGTTWAGDWTAAVEVDTTNIPTAGTSVTITDCTYDANYSGMVRDKSAAGKANAVITVN